MDRFIETVRKYPCLWNTTAIEYRDQELKDAAWAEVMKETDLSSVKEVKMKWKKLRDSYRDALKRQSEGAAGGAGALRRGFPWKYSAHMQFLQPHMGCRRAPAAPAPRRASSDSSSGSDPPPPPASKRRRELEPAPPSPPPPPDPLDIFFSSMCQSTKRFPFQTQIRIKRALFEAVMQAEEALLAEQARYAGRWAASSSASSEPDGKPC